MKRLPSLQRGAALLMAMLVVALVATLASGMIWQQWRAVQVEAAERSRLQSAWVISGALDYARFILREDARGGGADYLGEPWSLPLAEARLSTFLAADKTGTVTDADNLPDAFLSGYITDAQSRYNLRNLVEGDKARLDAELAVFGKLCEIAGVGQGVAERIALRLRDAALPVGQQPAGTALFPKSVAQLGWLGVDDDTLRRLSLFVVLLPTATPVNVNTAPREVIAAVVGLDVGGAERLVQLRQRAHFKSTADVSAQLPALKINLQQIAVASSYFEVYGRLRLVDRVLQERSLVRRNGLDVVVLSRERASLQEPPA